MPTDEEWAGLVSKLDALSYDVESLKPKEDPDPTPKTDARDTSIAKGKAFFITYLDKVLPKEKLDTLSFDELVLAAELKSVIKPSNLNPAPPISKTDAKTDNRPEWLIPTVESA